MPPWSERWPPCLPEAHALDFGAGTAQLTRRLQRGGQFASLTGADLFARSADLDAGIRLIEGDLNNPLLPASFDTIVAAEVIEHLENPRASAASSSVSCGRAGWSCSTPNNVELAIGGGATLSRSTSSRSARRLYPAHITAVVQRISDLRRAPDRVRSSVRPASCGRQPHRPPVKP